MAHSGCLVPQTLRPGVRAELRTKVLSFHPLTAAVPPPVLLPAAASLPILPPSVHCPRLLPRGDERETQAWGLLLGS